MGTLTGMAADLARRAADVGGPLKGPPDVIATVGARQAEAEALS